MVKIHYPTESNWVDYTMDTRSTNQTLCYINPRARNSGIVIIGTIFCILNPRPVKIFITAHDTLILTDSPVIIVNSPIYFMNSLIQQDSETNSTMKFCKNGINVCVGPQISLRNTCTVIFVIVKVSMIRMERGDTNTTWMLQ